MERTQKGATQRDCFTEGGVEQKAQSSPPKQKDDSWRGKVATYVPVLAQIEKESRTNWALTRPETLTCSFLLWATAALPHNTAVQPVESHIKQLRVCLSRRVKLRFLCGVPGSGASVRTDRGWE